MDWIVNSVSQSPAVKTSPSTVARQIPKLFGSAFPNHNGEGLTRAKRALEYMFRLAASNPRVTRLYIFQWTGGRAAKERFDAGLTDAHSKVRPAYCAIYEQMLHKRSCPYRTAKD